ncbi:AI-2E family transporter [Azospirillum brasilense]|uniref:AI-2E family transporter n=1 Tax=Azospirillum brasilense TaxID=192 RepID=A0A6L3AST4_AZOBR|nr:AI-2E family transporter [Azospirillum brasilense]KAA0678018.1 AI-2E family transporter [Azospirillum brasilense]
MADFIHDRFLPHADASESPERYEMSYVRKALVLSMMLILLIGCFVVLRPFIAAILWAIILSFSTWPLHQRIERALGGRTTLAAAIMTLMIMAILVGPLAALGIKLSENVFRVVETVHAAMNRGLPPLPDWLIGVPIVGDRLQVTWSVLAGGESNLRTTLQPYIGQIRDFALASGGHLLSGTSLIALSVLIAFFLYRDGRTAVRRLHSIVGRIAGARARQSLDVAAETINGVVHGVLGTALVQAIAATVGYWIAGIPGVLLLGFVSFFLALVPMGLALIWLPAAIWLASQGRTAMAIFLVAWVGVLVGSLDNVLRPILIGRSSDLPFIIIFLGIVGGLVAFGLIGIFLGPTLLAVAYGLVREWSGGNEPGDAAAE